MDLQLSGLHAVVTGGSSGIGAAIVQALASEGCRVSFCAREQSRIDTLRSGLQNLAGEVQGYSVDVCDEPAFADWLERLGAFDIFIPNVSAISSDWKASLAIDISATVANCEAVLPYLLKSDSAALTYIGSKAGSIEAPNSASYGASKAAMAHYMKSLSTRLLPRLRVNTVSPGDTLAPDGLWDRVRLNNPDEYAKVVQRNPMGRLATAEEIARVVAFVSSPAASFVSGANWYVDGGSVGHVQS